MSTAVSTPVWNVSSSAALEMPCIFIFFRKAGSLVLLAFLNGTPKRPASSWVDAARKARSGPWSPRALLDRISGFSGWELHPVHPVILSKDRWGRLKRGQVRAVKRGSCRTQADDTEVVPPALITSGFRGSGGSGSVPTGFRRGFCKSLCNMEF